MGKRKRDLGNKTLVSCWQSCFIIFAFLMLCCKFFEDHFCPETRISDPITLFSHHCALELYVTTLCIQTFQLKKIEKFDRI